MNNPRLKRILNSNRVYLEGLYQPTTATLKDLRHACPYLTDPERMRLLKGQSVTRHFKTARGAAIFYISIHGDDHPDWGGGGLVSRMCQERSDLNRRWWAGCARKWRTVYAVLVLKGRLVTENS